MKRIRLQSLIGPIIVAVSGIVMLIWSWGTWPDPVVDFGREVYVPWRLSEGEVLYRDIVSYFNGPLTPYLHALLFKFFGFNLRTLVIFNLILIAGLVAMLYRLIAQTADALTATACMVTFFVLFAFAQFLNGSNYNFVCPYSYELPHGIFLTVVGITCLTRWQRNGNRIWLVGAGIALGLVFLTKAEVFLAALVGMGTGLAATLWVKRVDWRRSARAIGIFAVSAIAPIAITFGLLLLGLSPALALRGLAGSWRWVGQTDLTQLQFFKEAAGTDNVGQSLIIIGRWSGVYAMIFVPPLLLGFLLRQSSRRLAMISLALIGALLLIVVTCIWRNIPWSDFLRPAPLILAMAVLFELFLTIRRRDGDDILRLTLCVWAFVLLAKIPLNARVAHYGFALAMPAMLIIVAMLVGWLPAWLNQRKSNGLLLRGLSLLMLAVTLFAHCFGHYGLHYFWEQKQIVVGRGGDVFIADSRGALVNAVLAQLQQQPRSATLVSIPEGLMINYLARRQNPTGQLNFTPPAIIMYGEDVMLRAFEQHSPDLILIIRIKEYGYGSGYFGEDYGLKLAEWIAKYYEPIGIIAHREGEVHEYDMKLLKRRQ